MQSPSPFEFDLEIERTFHSKRNKLKLKKQRAKAQGASMMVGWRRWPKKDALRFHHPGSPRHSL